MSERGARALSELREQYLVAVLAGDRRASVELVRAALDDGVEVLDLYLEVVAEAQREIGRLWQQNRITVADEHQATAISQVVLSQLYARLPRRPPTGRKIVLACVEGELHDMALRIAGDILEAAGLEVCFLGANVPTSSLLTKISEAKPDALLLSVTMTFHSAAARDAVRRVRDRFPALPIVVGGEAIIPHAATWGQDVVVSRGSALELAATIDRTLGAAA